MSGDATGDPWTHPGWCLMKSPSCHSREATVAAVAAWKDCKCSCKAILRCYNSDVIAHAHKYAQIIHMQSQSVVCVGSETFRETNHLIYIIQRSTMIYNVPFGATKSVISADLVDSQHYPFHVQYSTRLNHIAHPESASAWAATRTSGTQIGASMSSQASSKVMLFSSETAWWIFGQKRCQKASTIFNRYTFNQTKQRMQHDTNVTLNIPGEMHHLSWHDANYICRVISLLSL